MTDVKKEHKKFRKANNKTSQKLGDRLLIWTILIFGFAGLLYILDHMKFKKDERANFSIYEDTINDNRTSDTKKILVDESIQKELIVGEQLHVDGPLEAHTPVLFEVENFYHNAEYLLDFGDGIRRVLNQRTDSHIYDQPGNYKLELYVTYKGERQKLASQNIMIMEPITVATNATRIDF